MFFGHHLELIKMCGNLSVKGIPFLFACPVNIRYGNPNVLAV